MLNDLIIVGAGGSSREIAGVVADINQFEKKWNLLGFLDDDPLKIGSIVDGLPVLGKTELVSQYPQVRLVVGIANYKNPSTRKEIAEKFQQPIERFATIVHPSACISASASIGYGTVVLQGVVITSATVIGNHVLISQGTMLGHDISVKDYVTIAPRVVISGGVIIEQSAYIGAGAVIAPGVVVGAEALIGIGSTVVGNVNSRSTVFGNPARTINLVGGLRRWAR
jgi:sugar O-acyltransferase (sialic acid O-acetyltransferase NeuD family)